MEYLPINDVRIGLIGLGQRGLATLQRYMQQEGCRFTRLADCMEAKLATGQDILQRNGRPNACLMSGEHAWKEICESKDVDLVYICTDWQSHTSIATYAMHQGKDVAVEVPAATSIEECKTLLQCVRETGRRCMMLENCCYDTFHLGMIGMQEKGLFGNITHAEGAYIHDLSSLNNWMTSQAHASKGNPYPTHGIGPVCQLLGINKVDELKSIISVDGLNGINNSIIKTKLGRTILLQHDMQTPRPYNRLQTLCGTHAFAQKYPLPTLCLNGITYTGDEAIKQVESYTAPEIKRIQHIGRLKNIDNLMNFVMDYRLLQAIHEGKPFDISIEEAITWCSITEYSAKSAAENGSIVTIGE